MERVIEEMARAKDDVERRLRQYIPEIIRECMAFAYLGKTFTFDIQDLSDKVNAELIALSDAILDDIESRAKTAIKYAEEEDDEDVEPADPSPRRTRNEDTNEPAARPRRGARPARRG